MAAEVNQAIRQGLPRRRGGAPWPPAGTTPVATSALASPLQPSMARRGIPVPILRWVAGALLAGIPVLLIAVTVVIASRAFLDWPAVAAFVAAYPGEYPLPDAAPVGFPAWLAWQHFFSAFLILLIIRSGLQVRRERRPAVLWTSRRARGAPRAMSLTVWFHQSLDLLWVLNGLLYVVLLFASGHWMRIVPTNWEVFPNALSAALQYASLEWPTGNSWVNYNGLQQLAYFATVFVAAPLAIASGVRMSDVWPRNAARLNRLYPIEWARRVHFPVMVYFVLFIAAHTALVLATGARRNLNHMYALQDRVDWTGLLIFAGSLGLMAAAVLVARPSAVMSIARRFGAISRG